MKEVLTSVRRSLAALVYPELRREREFMAVRSENRRDWGRQPRLYGISSDAMTDYALGLRDKPTMGERPHDPADLAACERVYALMPKHLQRRAEPVMTTFRAHVACVTAPRSVGA